MNKLDAIVCALKEEIGRGLLMPGDKFPSESEIAERFGVNGKTANKASSLLVAEGLLVRGKRGQYTRVARFLPFHRRPIVFLGSVRLPFYAMVFDGIASAARHFRYPVNYLSPDSSELLEVLGMLESVPPIGIITHAYGPITIPGVPVMHVDLSEYHAPQPEHTISCDNYAGGRRMMQEVLRRGHRDIVICFNRRLIGRRLVGFQDAMQTAGITDTHERTFYTMDSSASEINATLKKMRTLYPDLTAIVCGSDPDMFAMAKALDEANMNWHGEIALTGFGNLPGYTEILRTATVDQQPFRMGQLAVERLLAIAGGADGAFSREELDVEIIGAENIPAAPAKPSCTQCPAPCNVP